MRKFRFVTIGFSFLSLALMPQERMRLGKHLLGAAVLSGLTILLFAACGQSPESARRELEQSLNVEYSEASFVDQAGKGDVWAVQLFLQAGMAPDVTNSKGITPLMAAILADRKEVAKLLEAKGAQKLFFDRYTIAGKVITDTKTCLDWYVGPDRNTNWDEAKSWASFLEGGGWRLPTRQELKTLYHKGWGEKNIAPIFQPAPSWVWTTEQQVTGSGTMDYYRDDAWAFNFYHGEESCLPKGNPSAMIRAFAVRPSFATHSFPQAEKVVSVLESFADRCWVGMSWSEFAQNLAEAKHAYDVFNNGKEPSKLFATLRLIMKVLPYYEDLRYQGQLALEYKSEISAAEKAQCCKKLSEDVKNISDTFKAEKERLERADKRGAKSPYLKFCKYFWGE